MNLVIKMAIILLGFRSKEL